MFSGFMVTTWVVATVVAVVAGVVGFFVVARGSAFAAHALPLGAFSGAAAAALAGVSTLVGLVGFSVLGAVGISRLSHRARRDVATALVLVVLLGLGALFLSMTSEYAPEIYSLLFGEVIGVSTSSITPIAVLGAICVVMVAVAWRPLLLSSISPELGEVAGVSSGRMELWFLLVLAAVTAMALPVVGALLVFSLMVGPPAAARSFTSKPHVALAGSVLVAVVTVWAAIAVSYQTNWPVGFFVGIIGAGAYFVGRSWSWWVQTGRSGWRLRRGAALRDGRPRTASLRGAPAPR
ncbi:MAG: metal ABC transporter permease [Actinomycetota bacterium]|jgi:zinc/manganese transport system permease protein|nr:metal ABC transporter permease [Actinomycetota bacterium]